MTPEQLTALHANDEPTFSRLVHAEYKSNMTAFPERRDHHSEVLRAKWVLFLNKNEDWTNVLSRNLVARNIIEELTGQEFTVERREKRSDKYQKLIDWCKENHLRQFTVQDLCELAEISYPTALKFTKDRPDLVFKVKKGLYEARNPEIIRKEERQATATNN